VQNLKDETGTSAYKTLELVEFLNAASEIKASPSTSTSTSDEFNSLLASASYTGVSAGFRHIERDVGMKVDGTYLP
jgi:hypothetical protein